MFLVIAVNHGDTDDSDFSTTPEDLILTFTGNSASCQTISYDIEDDGTSEGSEVFRVAIVAADPNGILGVPQITQVTINDDDGGSMGSASVNDNGGCAHTDCLTDADGTITSVNYPNNYADNADDSWLITAAEDDTITVYFSTDFRIEHSSDCDVDYVQLYDGPTRSSNPLDDPFCGTTPPPCLTSSGNEVLIVFTSDSANNEKGFSLTYNLVGTYNPINVIYYTNGILSDIIRFKP